jgi:3'-phosphoadenosine 5'-phosphosulfate sulfotransferase (PAPS reductase)/FAD synthetase
MNPYLIPGPALVSFSGGRTSGYMLKQILLAHGGVLPPDVVVTFANTGRERRETLQFVRDVEVYFGVPIHWLERGAAGGFVEVGHNSASLNGEPFDQLILQKKYLPNPVTRFCTIELKIRVMRDFARSLGWDHWTNIVGLRADEPARVIDAMARNDAGKERWTNVCPLHTARVTKADVLAFWAAQPFDLQLRDHEGNCDLCFLKGQNKLLRILRDRPDLGDWWIAKEAQAQPSKPSGARFRADRPSYAALADFADRQAELPFLTPEEDGEILESCGWACHE